VETEPDMSALDDALARARTAPAVGHEPTSSELWDVANAAFDALVAETFTKLRSSGVEPLDVYRLEQSEYRDYTPERVARAWPMQVFMITDEGQPIDYEGFFDGASKYDRSGKPHIFVGTSLGSPMRASATNSNIAFRKTSPTKVLYRPISGSTCRVVTSSTMDDRFPQESGAAYPLEDFLAHALLELLGER
jgi:hypothetical protein